jgi:hypothetical protein
MNRRDMLQAFLMAAIAPSAAIAATPSVSTLIGNGQPGLSDQ